MTAIGIMFLVSTVLIGSALASLLAFHATENNWRPVKFGVALVALAALNGMLGGAIQVVAKLDAFLDEKQHHVKAEKSGE